MTFLRESVKARSVSCFRVYPQSGCYISGVYVSQAGGERVAAGNIQPSTRSDIERLPENSRSDGAITIFTLEALQATDSPNSVADQVEWDGQRYEVQTVERWPSHNRYVCTKVGQ